MDINSLAHTKWNCKYHIVFAPKYRRKIIYGQLKRDCVNADTDGVFLSKSKKSSSSLLIVAPPEFIMIPIKVLKSIFRFREKLTLGFQRNKHGLLANSEI